MRVIWAPRAIARATEIGAYIAAERPDSARRWVEELFALAAGLRRHPRAGRKVPEAGRDELRQVLHGKYRLIYRIERARLVVLTVRHGRRAWDPAEVLPDA
ncbi:MAG: type II toxin-antitoxin system RelE/ParE family toxin [Gemmatimonadaceae bacterium]